MHFRCMIIIFVLNVPTLKNNFGAHVENIRVQSWWWFFGKKGKIQEHFKQNNDKDINLIQWWSSSSF